MTVKFSDLPVEIVVHIFAFLEPKSLNLCIQVCKIWLKIIKDDSCWRAAYGRLWPRPPFHRISTTWRAEYTLRVNLANMFLKSTGGFKQHNSNFSIQFQPRIGTVHKLLVNFDHDKILCASLESGSAVFCDSKTGKVSKEQILLKDENVLSDATCVKLGLARIVCGFSDGKVTVISQLKDEADARHQVLFNGIHRDRITCIEILSARDGSDAFYLFGSVDGRISLWQAGSGTFVKSFKTDSEVYSIAVDNIKKKLVASCKKSIHVWKISSWNEMMSISEASDDVPETVIAFNIQNSSSCKQFLLDTESDLAFIPFESKVEVYHLQKKVLVQTLDIGASGRITTIAWDGETEEASTGESDEALNRRRCAFVAGTDSGQCHVWDISRLLEEKEISPKPSYCLGNHLISSPVSSLQIDFFKAVIGYSNGCIKVFDFLSGQELLSLNGKYVRNQEISRRRREFPNSSSSPINCIIMSNSVIAIAVENTVRVWDFDVNNEFSPFSHLIKRKLGQKRKKNRLNHGHVGYKSPRAQLQYEAKQELKESNRVLQLERAQREQALKNEQKNNHLDLSEAEMVAYAKMLSLETEAKSPQRPMAFPSRYSGSSSLTSPQAIPHQKDAPFGSFQEWPKLGSSQKSNASLSSSMKGETSRRSQGLSPASKPRKLSISEFMDNFQLEAAAVTSPIDIQTRFGGTGGSSSYRNTFNHMTSAGDDDDEFYEQNDDYHSQYHHLRTREANSGRRSSGYSSIQVVPHPDTKKREEQEEEDLLYALELSMQDQ
ncbi:hypothetical protein MP638_003444 [Amoeboaphelidium occidentale]|nr:hypothetical protein MP638_003444 [Amoeboaphelidium occidentale]